MCEECGCGLPQAIGEVTHYYSKPKVVVIRADGLIKNGEQLRVKGHTTDFTMTVQGMRDEQEQEIESAHSGQLIAFRTPDVARPGDMIYRVEGEGG